VAVELEPTRSRHQRRIRHSASAAYVAATLFLVGLPVFLWVRLLLCWGTHTGRWEILCSLSPVPLLTAALVLLLALAVIFGQLYGLGAGAETELRARYAAARDLRAARARPAAVAMLAAASQKIAQLTAETHARVAEGRKRLDARHARHVRWAARVVVLVGLLIIALLWQWGPRGTLGLRPTPSQSAFHAPPLPEEIPTTDR